MRIKEVSEGVLLHECSQIISRIHIKAGHTPKQDFDLMVMAGVLMDDLQKYYKTLTIDEVMDCFDKGLKSGEKMYGLNVVTWTPWLNDKLLRTNARDSKEREDKNNALRLSYDGSDIRVECFHRYLEEEIIKPYEAYLNGGDTIEIASAPIAAKYFARNGYLDLSEEAIQARVPLATLAAKITTGHVDCKFTETNAGDRVDQVALQAMFKDLKKRNMFMSDIIRAFPYVYEPNKFR